jgi:hypothetical protein
MPLLRLFFAAALRGQSPRFPAFALRNIAVPMPSHHCAAKYCCAFAMLGFALPVASHFCAFALRVTAQLGRSLPLHRIAIPSRAFADRWAAEHCHCLAVQRIALPKRINS